MSSAKLHTSASWMKIIRSFIKVLKESALKLYLAEHFCTCCRVSETLSSQYGYIVRKGIPAPLFKAPTPWPSLPPFLKLLFPLPYFMLHPLLRYFPQSPFPHPHANLLLLQSDQPTPFRFKQISKGYFTSSTVTFYQKSISNLSNLFTNRLS